MKIFFALSLFATMMLIATESYSQIAKHIIIIRTDDIGANYNIDHTIPTPNIDRMASQGLTITTNYALIACAPDRVMFETMNYNQYIGIYKNPAGVGLPNTGIPTKIKPVSKYFQDAGYRTGFVGKWHIGDKADQLPPKRGYDESVYFPGGGRKYDPPTALYRNGNKFTTHERLDTIWQEEAVAFIKRNKNTAFFLAVNTNSGHKPLSPSAQQLARCTIGTLEQREFCGLVTGVDDLTGAILDNAPPNTLIIFDSDNGCMNGGACNNGPLRGGKGEAVGEAGARVPGIVWWKGVLPAGQKRTVPTITMDLSTTALQAAGIALPKKISGIGQLNYWKTNKPNPTRCLFWGTTQTRGAVRCGNFKYYTDDGVMYDVVHDISEARDLSKSNPTMTAKLIKALKAWQSKLPPPNYQTFPGGGEE